MSRTRPWSAFIALLAAAAFLGLLSTPSLRAATDGAIQGRVYIDLNSDGLFDDADVPLSGKSLYIGSGPSYADTSTDSTGQYAFGDLTAGSYTVRFTPQPCADFLNYNWVGIYVLGFCPIQPLPEKTIELSAGQQATADFPFPAFEGSVNGRLWLNFRAPYSAVVEAGIGGTRCWEGSVTQTLLASGAQISTFSIPVLPNDPNEMCRGGEFSIRVDKEILHTVTWNELWQQLWIDWLYEGDYFSSLELANPKFYGVFGSAAGTPDGTAVSAIIGGHLCGQVTTKAQGESGNFWGLVVTPGRNCGEPGKTVTYCLGNRLAAESGVWSEVFGYYQSLTSTGEACPPLAYADANCDKDVNAIDALEVLRAAAGLPPLGDCVPPAGDTDCDGSREADDALLVLRFVARLSINLPPGCDSFYPFS